MHPSRIALVGGALIGLASLPLGFLHSDLLGAVSGVEADAWPAVALLAAAATAGLFGDRHEGLPAAGTVLVVLLTAAAAVFAIAKLVDAGTAADVATASGGSATIGAGPWVLVAAAVGSTAGAVATTSRRVV
jgi:hypothetical protein